MSGKLKLLFWSGILLLFVPFLGIPREWRTILTIVIAVLIIYLTFGIRKHYHKTVSKLKQNSELSL